MSKVKFEYPVGATPLDPNEIAGLRPTYISTQSELNAAEQANILEGEKWAGTYRSTDKSIGVKWFEIPAEMNKLIGDVSYWISQETYPMDEIATRFHHRLVLIHPFPNGNGRWARALTDVLLSNLGHDLFTWGSRQNQGPLDQHNKVRDQYIHALQMADARNFSELLKFVRS
jgi:Fic-DOC domain mobile mystery protein B